MSSYGEQKKAWAREWAHRRADFLKGRLLDILVQPVPGSNGFWWECPVCGELGSEIASEGPARTAGRGHMQTHVTDDDYETLEDLKVTTMPENLLTPYQRRRRDAVLESRAE